MILKDHLAWMTDRVRRGEPFCHWRLNDFELDVMLGLKTERHTNGDGHRGSASLRDALLRCASDALTKRPAGLVVGSYWQDNGWHPGAKALVSWAARMGYDLDALTWCESDLWYSREPVVSAEAVVDLLYILRCASINRLVFVAPERIHGARYCMGAGRCITVPVQHCWESGSRVSAEVTQECHAHPDAIFVWCCGPAKPWVYDTWRAFPGTTHVDAGHLFDAAFGVYQRCWHREGADRNGPMWDCYMREFAPYVRSFIP